MKDHAANDAVLGKAAATVTMVVVAFFKLVEGDQ